MVCGLVVGSCFFKWKNQQYCCLFHIYLSMCWSISLQMWVRSRFLVLVGLLWNWVRSKFFVNCIFFHIYLSMCWSIFLQILVRSRFHMLVGLLWNWVRSKFLLNCIAFFMSTIDVLVNLFANLNTIKVPRVCGFVVKLSEIKVLSLWIVKSLLWNEVKIEVLELEKVVSLINYQYHTKYFFFQGQL